MAKRSKRRNGEAPPIVSNTDAPVTVAQQQPAWSSRDWFWSLLLLAAVLLTYLPVLKAGFIWDDNQHLTANPVIVGPLGLKEIWTTAHARICPLVLTAFWFEYKIWGLTPLPYHLVVVFQHAASAAVLWRVLLALRVPGAWFGAALWALHPVQVETVAWITEMKNTQSGLFYFLSVLFFVKDLTTSEPNRRGPWNWNYVLTLLFAAMAMASKSSTVILPLILCLCAWWMEGRWNWRTIAKVGPIFLISAVAAVVSMWTQHLEGANDPHYARGLLERLITAGDVVWFYLGKLLWPHPLIFIYPRWEIKTGEWTSYLPLLALVSVLSALWIYRRSGSRPWFFAMAYFIVALLPVLGLVDHYFLRYSFVGDHFQYLASAGPLALGGAGIAWFGKGMLANKPILQGCCCAGLLLILAMLSWSRIWVYASQDTLWADTLAQNPKAWIALNNIGAALTDKGQPDEAIPLLRRALELNPRNAEAEYNLGLNLFKKGQTEESISHLRKSLEIDSTDASTNYAIGGVLTQKGQLDEAITYYQTALKIRPGYFNANLGLGRALSQKERWDESIPYFVTALKIKPGSTDAYLGLGDSLAQKGQLNEAISCFRKALDIDPNNADACNNLGVIFAGQGRSSEAIAQFQEALRLRPGFSDAQRNLANVQAPERQKKK